MFYAEKSVCYDIVATIIGGFFYDGRNSTLCIKP
jgi:hypothetical protein